MNGKEFLKAMEVLEKEKHLSTIMTNVDRKRKAYR